MRSSSPRLRAGWPVKARRPASAHHKRHFAKLIFFEAKDAGQRLPGSFAEIDAEILGKVVGHGDEPKFLVRAPFVAVGIGVAFRRAP